MKTLELRPVTVYTRFSNISYLHSLQNARGVDSLCTNRTPPAISLGYFTRDNKLGPMACPRYFFSLPSYHLYEIGRSSAFGGVRFQGAQWVRTHRSQHPVTKCTVGTICTIATVSTLITLIAIIMRLM